MKPTSALARTFAAASLSICASSALAWSDDAWTGHDKNLHFAVSAASGIAASIVLEKFAPQHAGFVQSFALGMVPGIIREAAWPNPSYKDLVWDAAGAAAGAYLGVKFIAQPLVGRGGRIDGVQLSYRTRY